MNSPINRYLKTINDVEERIKVLEKNNLKNLVNNHNYKNIPYQNWCNYQEGFSTKLLDWFLDYKNINAKELMFLDPFCGSGASLVSAKLNEFRSIGIDINPFSYLLSKVKLDFYSEDELKIIEGFNLPKYKEIKNVYEKYEFSMVERIFSKENFTKIELIKNSIGKITNIKSQEFLKVALVSSLESCSNYKKGGNGLKKRKKTCEIDFYELFTSKKNQMILDKKKLNKKTAFKLINGNIKDLDVLVENNSIDISFFSPPYPNCFDYFEIYKIELWIGEFITSYSQLRNLRKSAFTSNLNANLNQNASIDDSNSISKILFNTLLLLKEKDLWNKNIPKMLNLYFSEMNEFLNSLYQKMKFGGTIGIVIGNSSYGGIPILSDLIVSEISEKVGFKVDQIIVARNNETASQQYKKINDLIKYVRESIVVLVK